MRTNKHSQSVNLSLEHKALFCLLRAGLWEKEPDDLSLFPLTDERWWDVYQMAMRQTVAGIVYRGLLYLPDNLLPDDSLMIRWVAQVDSIERKNKRMTAVAYRLIYQMRRNGLHPVLLKGQGVAAWYEQPLLRECGDIDLYFPSAEEAQKAFDLMCRAGCRPRRQPDGSDHYCWQGIEVEHHTRLFDLYNPLLRGYLSTLIREHGVMEMALTGGASEEGHIRCKKVSVPSPLLNLMMLNAHLLKHLMGHGIGLRQFCDMARAYHVLCGSYSPEELKAAYKRTGLFKWSVQLHTFLTQHLGLCRAELPYADMDASTSSDWLHIVLSGGNFGQYGETKGKVSQARWERKLHTLLSFWKRRGFSGTYARKEAFWTSVKLFIGNIK